MKVNGYVGNERVTFDIDGLPTPVVNVTNTGGGRSNRVEALYAALTYHRDHAEEDVIPSAEDICGTAQCFEYFFDKGEFPAG